MTTTNNTNLALNYALTISKSKNDFSLANKILVVQMGVNFTKR